VETPSSSIPTLRSELDAKLAPVMGVKAVYLFGSTLGSENPNDVDLAVVYDPPLAPLTAPTVSPLIQDAVVKSFGLHAHLTFFTPEEAKHSRLLTDRETVYERSTCLEGILPNG
jgi:predicted nucleotidyltransferase